MGVSASGVAPFIAIRMSCYDSIMTNYSKVFFTKEQIQNSHPKFLMFNMFSGSFAVIIAVSICYPFDLVKRLMQLNGSSSQYNFNGIGDALV